jgi:hypothetical protein
MNTLEVVQIVEAWAVETVPGLSSYDHPPEQLDEALPMVLAEVITNAQADANQQLPGTAQYQQTFIRTWALDLILLIDPDPAWTASHTLYGYVDALGQAVTDGVRLGDNVVMSQFYTASYDPPEVEYGDGTIARQVTLRLTVGETIGVT